MRRWIGVFGVLGSLGACASIVPVSDRVAGCYAASDGIRYNRLRLCLNRDGTFTSELTGDIGSWGAAAGTWSLRGEMIQLVAETETERHSGWLAGARIASSKVLEPLGPKGELAWEPLELESP